MNNKKRYYGNRPSPTNFQDRNKLMNDLYWTELNILKRSLEIKYENFRMTPTTHYEYSYYSKRFMDNYKNSGIRWRDYWEEKLQEAFDKELSTERIKIWEQIKSKYDLPKSNKSSFQQYRNEKFKKEESEQSQSLPVSSEVDDNKNSLDKEAEIRHEKTKSNDLNSKEEVEETQKTPVVEGACCRNCGAAAELKKIEPKQTISQELVAEPTNIPTEVSQVAVNETSNFTDKLKNYKEELKTFDVNRCENQNELEIKKDMNYLLAWLNRLTPSEAACLLNLVQEESAERSELVETYFDLLHNEEDSRDEETTTAHGNEDSRDEEMTTAHENEDATCSREEANAEISQQPQIHLLGSLPVTQRKS